MGTGPSLAKITAHAKYLLDDFIQLRERYELLHPMLFDQEVVNQYHNANQARGFAVLRRSLFLTCCQDIVKLTRDEDERNPSMYRIMEDMASPEIMDELRQRNCDAELWCERQETDPTLAAIYRAREPDLIAKYRNEFDHKYEKAIAFWPKLKDCPTVKDCMRIRHKITAHTEVDRKTLKPIDISTLDITYGDLKPTIDDMQTLVEMISQLVRSSSFAWEQLDRLTTTAAYGFWRNKAV